MGKQEVPRQQCKALPTSVTITRKACWKHGHCYTKKQSMFRRSPVEGIRAIIQKTMMFLSSLLRLSNRRVQHGIYKRVSSVESLGNPDHLLVLFTYYSRPYSFARCHRIIQRIAKHG